MVAVSQAKPFILRVQAQCSHHTRRMWCKRIRTKREDPEQQQCRIVTTFAFPVHQGFDEIPCFVDCLDLARQCPCQASREGLPLQQPDQARVLDLKIDICLNDCAQLTVAGLGGSCVAGGQGGFGLRGSAFENSAVQALL